MLHLLSRSPLLAAVIERIGGGDDVVLVDGAVCSALNGHQDNLLLRQLLAEGCRVYALREMLLVHGLEPQRWLAGVEAVDYAGLVELTVKNPVIHSWC
ncbi:DsrH/TusB family sulfur metabolism protein [Methylomonas montana]|uniref:DsrH/TusB family sulfur relay protein n=1 Tax=Methylomonas montana TaxID=3058963 RepID=UPI00265AE84B|nr:DsrH/TusB family sulfur metabolism protein [Methylomonas montana]WKJ89949.1 DsrH/TusB family sulfur metabolism protein [Methylomonas montana]